MLGVKLRFSVALLLSAAVPAAGQSPIQVILGVGKIGSWDTSITVTNPGSQAADFLLRPDCPGGQVFGPPCWAITGTIPPGGTYVLTDLSQAPALFNPFPQPFYLSRSSGDADLLVSARAFDTSDNCSRGDTLPVYPVDQAFQTAAMVFPGARRDAITHVNLLLMLPSIGDAIYLQSVVIAAKDGTGAVVGSLDYALTSGHPVFLLDVLGAMGISGLDGGSLWVEARPNVEMPPNPFAAVMTVSGQLDEHVVSGARVNAVF
jgi:hypothetical protein